MLVSDRLVMERRPVPGRLLPPPRDREAVRGFAYRVTFCDHEQLATLRRFVAGLEVVEPDQPDAPPGPSVFGDLMRNRGFGLYEIPFVGLARGTLRMMMLGERWPDARSLGRVAGLLGWSAAELVELAALAGVPAASAGESLSPLVCRHVGEIYAAAATLMTEQLVAVGREADRLTGRTDNGAWKPVALTACES